MKIRTAMLMHPQDRSAQARLKNSRLFRFVSKIMQPMVKKHEKVLCASLDAYGLPVKEYNPGLYQIVEEVSKDLEIDVPECYIRNLDYKMLVLQLEEKTIVIFSPEMIAWTPAEDLKTKVVQHLGVLLDHGVVQQNAISSLLLTIMDQSVNPLMKICKLFLQKYFDECIIGRKLTGDRLAVLYNGRTAEVVRDAIYDAGDWSPSVGEDKIQSLRDRAFRNYEEDKQILTDFVKLPPYRKYIDLQSPPAMQRVVQAEEWVQTEEFRKLCMCYHHPELATEWPAPFSPEEIVGADADVVLPLLKGTGFTNITTKQIWCKDPGIKDGQIERVLIDGNTSYSLGQWFPAEVPVVVEIQDRSGIQKQ